MVYWKKRLKRKNTLSSICFLILTFLFACKPYYDVNKSIGLSNNELLNYSSDLNFNSALKIVFNANFSNSKNYKVRGIINYFSEDKYQIFLYSKTLGIEIARIQLYNDSITLINKLNKSIQVTKTIKAGVLGNLSIENSDVLRLIFGRSLSNVSNVTFSGDLLKYKYTINQFNGEAVMYTFGYLKSNNIGNSKASLNCLYTNYSKKFNLPYILKGDVNANNENISFEINLSSVENIDSTKFKKFKNLPNYTIYNE